VKPEFIDTMAETVYYLSAGHGCVITSASSTRSTEKIEYSNMKRYLPKSKDDIQAVDFLQSCPFDVVKSDISKLLEFLQDTHWEVSEGIAKYLKSYVNEIKSDLLYILNSNDDEWKRRTLMVLIGRSSYKLDQELILALRRIAEHPTTGEIEEEVVEQAKEIIIKNNRLK